MGFRKRSPASCTRGVRGNDPLAKSIIRDNTRSPTAPQSALPWSFHDEALPACRRAATVGPLDPRWFDMLLEGNDRAGKLIVVQQRCPETPARVTFCNESSRF